MRITAILKILGPVILAVSAAMFACAAVSIWYNESPWPLLIGGGSGIVFGFMSLQLGRNASMYGVGMREGCAIVTLSWILTTFFGAIPFAVMHLFDSPVIMTWSQSYYEAMSGFTTTGSSVLTNVEIVPKGILFWRSLTHWFGGMGIVVLAVAILPKLGIGGMQAFRWESPGPLKTDKLVPRIQDTAKILYTVYLAVTAIELALLLMVGVKIFDALCYTFGTVGTGGFGIHNSSIAGLNNPAAEWIIAFFMWLSGVNFALTYMFLFRGKAWEYLRDAEFKTYALISIGATAAITATVWDYNDWSFLTALRHAFFQVSTIITTTGYATYDYNQWPVAALGVLCILMFIGGSTGSTGGGPKVLRHLISWKFIKNELLKVRRPNLVTTVKIGNRAISGDIVSSVMGLLFAYLLIFFLGGVALTFFGHDIVTSFTASIANLGNIGPGLNVVGPAGNYSSFGTAELWLLTSLMLLGRLEIYTVLVLLIPAIWKRV